MEYVIFCDESAQSGPKFSDFFGGAIVDGRYIDKITCAIKEKKEILNLNSELKWTKVTENYVEKYMEIIDVFFAFVRQGKIKVRIMFRNNENKPTDNEVLRGDDKYFKMYYQFVKHAFGLAECTHSETTFVRIYLDQLPDKCENCRKFKDYLFNIQNIQSFKDAKVRIRKEDIAEVKSHDHVILQCIDVILGAMFFRLNNLHMAKVEGTKRRGKRTVAKERLYTHINKNIREILPNFNIGISTGSRGASNPHWEHPYEHWSFMPK